MSATARHGHGSPVRRPIVLYVLGLGRSGSTLFERLLGSLPGFVNVGELVDLLPRIIPTNELCGCGSPFSECDFWQRVGKRAFGGWDPVATANMAHLQDQVARQRYLPQLLTPVLANDSFRARLARYQEMKLTTYRAIADESGADVVVDASKRIAPLVALRSQDEVDVRVLHLVRDVRGVACSWAKSDVVRPHATGTTTRTMASMPAWRAALAWTRMEAQATLATSLIEGSVTVRYEDFVATPRHTTEVALAALGLADKADLSDYVRGRSIVLRPSHGLSGNPSRFTTGEVLLREDEEWRTALSRRDRVTATSIGLPGLIAHRYPVLHHHKQADR